MLDTIHRPHLGARLDAGGVSIRVWAPHRKHVTVVQDQEGAFPLRREASGHFTGTIAGMGPGSRYWFRLDEDDKLYPDPASRFQPEGPHGPSQVMNPSAFRWTDADWPGCRIEGQVVYEMHVGTFTPEGTWAAAAEKLPFLKETGITLIEMMPVNDFPGRFGWGYDGVNLFAPTRLYGSPDDLRAFVNEAHRLGIGVILDVVYNHFGPDGNYLTAFSKAYFTDRYDNEWGEAINFDGPDSDGVREFVTANAAYWIEEFHFDGLRLDATQSLHDASDDHIVAAIARAARAAAGRRNIVLIGENEPQHTCLVRAPERGGHGLDALWNDDLHHSATVAMTGRREAYYEDHQGEPQEFIAAAKWGYLFQGQFYAHQRQARGTPGRDLPPSRFVTFLDNHDQIANSSRGLRFHLLTSPGRARAMTALILLMPGTPMLFQGQEFWASTPFLYFADHGPELAALVNAGRKDFLDQFPSIASPAMRARLAPPEAPDTFTRCKLDWAEVERNAPALALHRDLLRLRREDAAFRRQAHRAVDGSVLGSEAFVLRFFTDDDDDRNDRLLIVNLGRDLIRASIPDPLIAPPEGHAWRVIWSSEDAVYGGGGTPGDVCAAGWRIPGHAALVLGAEPQEPAISS